MPLCKLLRPAKRGIRTPHLALSCLPFPNPKREPKNKSEYRESDTFKSRIETAWPAHQFAQKRGPLPYARNDRPHPQSVLNLSLALSFPHTNEEKREENNHRQCTGRTQKPWHISVGKKCSDANQRQEYHNLAQPVEFHRPSRPYCLRSLRLHRCGRQYFGRGIDVFAGNHFRGTPESCVA